MGARGWGLAALAMLLAIFFVRACVRVNPVEEAVPPPASLPHVQDGADKASGMSVTSGPLLVPVVEVSPSALTDTFTQGRAMGARRHDAIDIMAPRGTQVRAAADGLIEKLFWSGDGGRTLYQRARGGRLLYYYAHLDGYAPGLHEQQVVRRGDVLGVVGSTGNADPSAPHLHFAVHVMRPGDPWYRGRAINPYPLLVGH